MGLIETIDVWYASASKLDKGVAIGFGITGGVLLGLGLISLVKQTIQKLVRWRRQRQIIGRGRVSIEEIARSTPYQAQDLAIALQNISQAGIAAGMSMEEATRAINALVQTPLTIEEAMRDTFAGQVNELGGAVRNLGREIRGAMAESMARHVDRLILGEAPGATEEEAVNDINDESGHPISMWSESSLLSADSISASLTSDEEPTHIHGERIPDRTWVRWDGVREAYVFVCSLCQRSYNEVPAQNLQSRRRRRDTMNNIRTSQEAHMVRQHRVPAEVKPDWEAGELEEAPPIRVIRMRKRA